MINMQMQMEMELPRGYNFCPTDEETIQYYLKKKVTGMPLAYDGIVLERNPYDEKQLPDIFSAAEKRDIFFFTKLTRKGRALQGHNFSRSIGNGTWRSDRTVDIKDQRGSLIGTAKTLGYSEKGSKKNKLIMTEYALPTKDSSLPYNPSKDWVLCRVKKNGRSKDGKNSGSSSVDNQEAPLLLPAADHHSLEANAANSSNPSSMVNDNSYAPKVEATPTITNLPISTGAPESTYVENGSPEVLDAPVPLDYHTNNAAAYYSSYPSLVVNGNSYTSEVETTELPTGVENSVQDDGFELLETLMAMDYDIIDNLDATPTIGSPLSTVDEFPPLGALQDVGLGSVDIPTGMDNVMDNSAATPITDFPVSTGDEFPPLETLITLRDVDYELLDTLQPLRNYIDNQLNNSTAAEPELFMNGAEGQFWTERDLQFTPSFLQN